jgi:DNA repair protein RadC
MDPSPPALSRVGATAPTCSAHEPEQQLALSGPEALSTAELIEVLLRRRAPGRGPRAAALRLLDRFGGGLGLAQAGVGELARVRGVSLAQARRLVAALALGRRLARTPLRTGAMLTSTAQVYDAYASELAGLRRERFLLVLLDARNRVLREDRVSQGTLTSSLVHPREVFATAIREAAAGLILLHNHPSGDPEPSPDDEAVTRRLVAAGELLGIPVLDHLVVGAGCYVSLFERGLIPPARSRPSATGLDAGAGALRGP